ncbi:MAG TPA: CPBP family glutamic-type intramembrane protease [Kofleriaceae bacterium]|jgi:hypothetical protein
MRELRALVPAEVAAVLVLAVVPLPEGIPVGIPLLAVASISRWTRGRTWAEVFGGGRDAAGIGAAAGLAALVVGLLIATPLVEALANSSVEWSQFPVVRGNVSQAVMAAFAVGLVALAMELALRGWIVERMLELSPGPATLPILAGALAEALVIPGTLGERIGAFAYGIGLGWMYVAGGRSVVAPVCARVTFAVGAVVLEALRVVG